MSYLKENEDEKDPGVISMHDFLHFLKVKLQKCFLKVSIDALSFFFR